MCWFSICTGSGELSAAVHLCLLLRSFPLLLSLAAATVANRCDSRSRPSRSKKKTLAKDMKNTVKKKKRLQGRASQLSDADLVDVLRMRKAKKGNEAPEPVVQE